MSDEERELFESKCSENSELKEQLEFTHDVKTIISERNKMLEKFQEWDNEYDEAAKHHKDYRVWIYWLSGIAAIFIIGLILFPINNQMDSGDVANLTPQEKELQNMKSDTYSPNSGTNINKEERHLAQNRDKATENTVQMTEQEENLTYSFGIDNFGSKPDSKQNNYNHELKQTEENCHSVEQEISQLNKQLNKGEISKEHYESNIGLLKYQRDVLNWKKVRFLIALGRKNEALEILDEMRREKGVLQSKADSLYNKLR